MVEFISNRIIDTNGLQQRCRQYLSEYNQVILDQLKNQTQKPSSGYWFFKANLAARIGPFGLVDLKYGLWFLGCSERWKQRNNTEKNLESRN